MISIHAPRTGSDCMRIPRFSRRGDFNPRSPHGERRPAPARQTTRGPYFNPRSPHGERLDLGCFDKKQAINFNPRSPHGERLSARAQRTPTGAISIHAPRTGSDGLPGLCGQDALISIHAPRTGSDKRLFAQRHAVQISIHAPRTGSDRTRRRLLRQDTHFNPRSPHGERRDGRDARPPCAGFQSTLPARGAT